MTEQRPGRLRLGFFTYLDGGADQADVYQQVIELFQAAEDLGIDAGWVAQHHFGLHGGLPSPFVFLTAVAERTERIGLGTALITVLTEDPLRVAEDAAVLESLHPGRLQLGLGAGSIGVQDTDPVARREAFGAAVTRIRSALAGEAVTDSGDVLFPPAPALLDRIWEGSASGAGAEAAAERGNGLLLSRVAWGPNSAHTADAQRPFVERYREIAAAKNFAPRIGLSRSVYVAADRATARADLGPGVDAFNELLAGAGLLNEAVDPFASHNIHHGHPEEVIESLLAEDLLHEVTDIICQVEPGAPSFEQSLRSLELLATEVAPELRRQLGSLPDHSDEQELAARS